VLVLGPALAVSTRVERAATAARVLPVALAVDEFASGYRTATPAVHRASVADGTPATARVTVTLDVTGVALANDGPFPDNRPLALNDALAHLRDTLDDAFPHFRNALGLCDFADNRNGHQDFATLRECPGSATASGVFPFAHSHHHVAGSHVVENAAVRHHLGRDVHPPDIGSWQVGAKHFGVFTIAVLGRSWRRDGECDNTEHSNRHLFEHLLSPLQVSSFRTLFH